jgi:kinesin family member C1
VCLCICVTILSYRVHIYTLNYCHKYLNMPRRPTTRSKSKSAADIAGLSDITATVNAATNSNSCSSNIINSGSTSTTRRDTLLKVGRDDILSRFLGMVNPSKRYATIRRVSQSNEQSANHSDSDNDNDSENVDVNVTKPSSSTDDEVMKPAVMKPTPVRHRYNLRRRTAQPKTDTIAAAAAEKSVPVIKPSPPKRRRRQGEEVADVGMEKDSDTQSKDDEWKSVSGDIFQEALLHAQDSSEDTESDMADTPARSATNDDQSRQHALDTWRQRRRRQATANGNKPARMISTTPKVTRRRPNNRKRKNATLKGTSTSRRTNKKSQDTKKSVADSIFSRAARTKASQIRIMQQQLRTKTASSDPEVEQEEFDGCAVTPDRKAVRASAPIAAQTCHIETREASTCTDDITPVQTVAVSIGTDPMPEPVIDTVATTDVSTMTEDTSDSMATCAAWDHSCSHTVCRVKILSMTLRAHIRNMENQRRAQSAQLVQSVFTSLRQNVAVATQNKMQSDIAQLTKDLQQKTKRSEILEHKAAIMNHKMEEWHSMEQQLREEISEKDDQLEQNASALSAKDSEISELTNQNTNARIRIGMQKTEINALREAETTMQHKLSAAEACVASNAAETESLQQQAKDAQEANAELQKELLMLQQWVTSHESQLAEANQKLAAAQTEIADLNLARMHDIEHRRKLHNQVQNLRGAIRVFCRLRPQSSSMDMDDDDCPKTAYERVTQEQRAGLNGEGLDVLTPTSASVSGEARYQQRSFEFDKVFSSDFSQEQVFSDLSDLVVSAMDGYNVNVFAYGQTGSGKTYTMMGPEFLHASSLSSQSDAKNVTAELSQSSGMIPRAVQQIFETAAQMSKSHWDYSFKASMIEIYNEEIHDLMRRGSKKLKYDIRMAADRKTVVVTNLNIMPVNSASDVQSMISKAAGRRAVASTQCNDHSSRSHTVFQLHITGHNSVSKKSVSSVLSLVDLAGSERLKQSKATGARAKETQMINSSLMTLSQCVSALASKKSHIPFRNSKLTYLLRESLGGDGKTAFFVNLSPDPESYNETLCTLRFAQKLTECELGAARQNVRSNSH